MTAIRHKFDKVRHNFVKFFTKICNNLAQIIDYAIYIIL